MEGIDTTVTATDTTVSPQDTTVAAQYFCTAPILNVKQDSLNIMYGGYYNFVPVTEGSLAVPVTIENFGNAPMILENAAVILLGSLEFSVSENFQVPLVVQPGETVTFDIMFTPDPQTTTEQTASVYITSNDPNSPYVFAVRGNQLYDLTVESSEGGIVCGTTQCGETFTEQQTEGTTATLIPLPYPAEDYLFTGWEVDNFPMGLDVLNLAIIDTTHVRALFTRKKYIIAGQVTLGGVGLSGVMMQNLPGGPITDAHGFYSAVVDSGWSGTIVPWTLGYIIPERTYEPVRADWLDQNYEANIEIIINGQILTAGGTGIADVLLEGFPELVFTNADGTFSTSVASGWSGNVTFTQAGYTFTPPAFAYANLTADLSGQDAVGTGTPTFTISGQVVDSAGASVVGVTMSGFPGVPVTSSDGAYRARVNSGWSGTITPQYEGGSITPASFTHTAVASNLTQNYTLARQYPLTVALAGTGTGSVTSAAAGIDCGSDCSETYTENTAVTLSAAPDTTSTFTGWSGGGCRGAGACAVMLTQAAEVSAVFTETTSQYTLTAMTSGDGFGTVLSMPTGLLCGTDCTVVADDGATFMLRAVPSSDSKFDGWSGGGCSGTGDCALTLTQNTIVTAAFSPAATLIIEKAGTGTGTVIADGIACGATCENSYPAGTGVALKAIPDAGSTFAGWQVNGQPSGCLVVIDGQTTVTATFEP